MTGGLSSFPQGRESPKQKPSMKSQSLTETPGFPQDMPPTLFHPSSPKVKATEPSKTEKDMDAASVASTSTFSSTVSLLKGSIKSKLPISYKAHKAQKELKEAAARSTAEFEGKPVKKSKALPSDYSKTGKFSPLVDYEARQRTAEAYMIHATTR
ncbi:hypothetical protein G7Y89_g802 [Cudoniella acicularis]|uniref:Uncharacterized protein n=1 Tax=Cudoniella acicularis TaxID=354080 RepID=A0A8H4RWI5_9HELO|nr:hypothetical protein G7Y89_g802 [Cudoniella acicularis]